MPEKEKDPVENVTADPFWEHFGPCRHALHAFIKKALNFSEDADDVFQETALRACRYYSSYDPRYAFRTWLYTIAHNELKKHYGRRHAMPAELPAEHLLVECAPGIDPLDRELARQLHILATRLKPAWREVFFLFYQDGFALDEVAAITGRSSGHVKFILFRARQAVRQLLGESR